MASLQDQETPIDQEMVNQLLLITPEYWQAVELRIERKEAFGRESYVFEIQSPEGFDDTVEPTDKLYDLTFRLADLFQRHGKVWKKVRYITNLLPSGNWRYSVEFEY